MLDVHQLNVFIVAAEKLNFTAAARQLHMSQPSVSQHITSLENQLGQPLFVRAGRRMELSAAGQALLPLAREVVTRSMHIEEQMQSLKGELFGELRVGCSTTPGKYILPKLLARFLRAHPNVTVSCQVSSQRTSLARLCDGEVHFTLASSIQLPCRHLEFFPFLDDQIKLIVPLSHPWAGRGIIEPDELYDANFIFRETTSGTQTTVEAALTEAGIVVDRLNTLLVLGNSEAIALAVQEGLGAGFVSSFILEKVVRSGVATVDIQGVAFKRAIYFGRNSRRPATVAQDTFWSFVCQNDT
ncbi:MAG: LysR family transcriptional regulator [Anaerolineales bacterium]|nr:LysR family transcriptional regulator [Anaerolineales bacterium]MCB8952590.1 LysR family transcriptional regulator [Ardenticatenales bacterium]